MGSVLRIDLQVGDKLLELSVLVEALASLVSPSDYEERDIILKKVDELFEAIVVAV